MGKTGDSAAGSAEDKYVIYKNSKIHYIKFGSGKLPLITFHGFSEEAASFLSLEPALSKYFTVYSFDFPYHGKTDWNESQYFSKNDLKLVIQALQEQEQFDHFSLFGFSMGGRICLSIVDMMGAQVQELYLAAPDGIKTHKVFDVAVYPSWGRWIFRKVTKRPKIFFFLVKLLYKYGRISKFLYEFTTNHMDTVDKRERIFNTWLSIKNFNENIPAIKKKINQHGIKVYLIFGRRDQVIKPVVGEYFQKGLNNAELKIIPKGHFLITESLNPFLEEILKDK